MALLRFTRSCLPLLCRKTAIDVNKLPLENVQRNFRLGQLRMDKHEKMDQIQVDSLSKIALVIDGKYKSLKDVPVFLPYNQVYKARDKFRIKASIASALFVLGLMFYTIRKNQRKRRVEEYEGMEAGGH